MSSQSIDTHSLQAYLQDLQNCYQSSPTCIKQHSIQVQDTWQALASFGCEHGLVLTVIDQLYRHTHAESLTHTQALKALPSVARTLAQSTGPHTITQWIEANPVRVDLCRPFATFSGLSPEQTAYAMAAKAIGTIILENCK